MKALKICDVGLHPDTSHAFHSMLKVVAGRSKADWSIGGVADADVMIASSGGDPASFAAWGASGKPFVLVVDDRGSWPPTPFVLRHPFRVMQLLSILDDVAEQFHGRSTSTPADSVAWSAAEALRLCMSRMGVGEWQVARGDLGEEVWLGGGSAHADPATLARLRELDLRLGAFRPVRNGPGAAAIAFPLCDLAWFVGVHGAAQLAPWLDRNATYRLRRWPDLGRLGVTTGLLELCAYATSRAWTPAALAHATGQSPDAVHRFLNAASLAGLLATTHAGQGDAPQPHAGTGRPSGWRRLIGGLRRRLGLAA
jgi:hypothetical protein